MLSRSRVWIVAACLLGGCGKESKQAPTPANAEPQPAATGKDAGAAAIAVAPDAPDVAPDDADARALIERWRAAQDAGDLAAYQRLYHESFEGIRRSGKQTKTLDRDGWIKDRASMFKKGMKVEVGDLVLARAGDRWDASFTQTWSSGTYRDRGPKQMRLVRDGDGWAIAREELLSSEVLPPDAPATTVVDTAAPVPGGLAFGLTLAADADHLELALIDDGEILLARSNTDLGEGDLVTAKKDEYLARITAMWVRRPIVTPPPALAAAAGVAVVVLDDTLARVCDGTIGAATAVEKARQMSKRQEIWDDPGPFTIRAALDAPCKGQYVRAAALPGFAVAPYDEKADEKLERATLKEIRRAHEELSADDVVVFVQTAADGSRWAAASFEVEDPCAADAGKNLALRSGAGKRVADLRLNERLEAAADLGGDGDVDLVLTGGVVDTGSGHVEIWRDDLTRISEDEYFGRCQGFGE